MNAKKIIANAILANHAGFKPTLEGVDFVTLYLFFSDLFGDEKEAEAKANELWNASK